MHHLAMILGATAAIQTHGISAKATIAIGGGAIIKARVNMQANGTTPGIATTSTATRAQASTPIHNGLEMQ